MFIFQKADEDPDPHPHQNKMDPELKTLEWDILNPDRLINLEINRGEQAF